MTRLAPSVALLAAVAGAGCGPVGAPSGLRGNQALLRGVVLSERGDTVEGAQIQLLAMEMTADAAPGSIVSDAQGAFQVGPVSSGRYEVRVRRIGFYAAVDTLQLRPGRELHRVIKLRESTWLAGCGSVIPFVLAFEPIDRRFGRRVNLADASFIAADGSFRASVEARRYVDTVGDSLAHMLSGVAGRPGSYDIELLVPGYQVWRARGVRVAPHECGGKPRVLRPRLERLKR